MRKQRPRHRDGMPPGVGSNERGGEEPPDAVPVAFGVELLLRGVPEVSFFAMTAPSPHPAPKGFFLFQSASNAESEVGVRQLGPVFLQSAERD